MFYIYKLKNILDFIKSEEKNIDNSSLENDDWIGDR